MKIQFFGALVLLAGCLPLSISGSYLSLTPTQSPSPVVSITSEPPLITATPITSLKFGKLKEIELGLTNSALIPSMAGGIQILQSQKGIPNKLFGFANQRFFSLNTQSQQIQWGETLPAVVNQLLIDPQVPHRFYAATEKGLYTSNNQGESWHKDENLYSERRMIGKNERISSLAINPQTNELWAGISSQTIYISGGPPNSPLYRCFCWCFYPHTSRWQLAKHST